MAAPCSGADGSGADLALRQLAAAEARRWLGTPYCHQASLRGAGADCLGLLRGVWRATLGAEPEAPPPYSGDWAEASGEERLMQAATRHLVPVGREAAGVGDVLLFRMRPRAPAKHLGLLVSDSLAPGRMIHAYSGHGVAETHLTAAWLGKLAAVFRFPGRGF